MYSPIRRNTRKIVFYRCKNIDEIKEEGSKEEDIYLLAAEEDNFLSKAHVFHCFLVFRSIGEYTSLDLFYCVSLTSSCSLTLTLTLTVTTDKTCQLFDTEYSQSILNSVTTDKTCLLFDTEYSQCILNSVTTDKTCQLFDTKYSQCILKSTTQDENSVFVHTALELTGRKVQNCRKLPVLSHFKCNAYLTTFVWVGFITTIS